MKTIKFGDSREVIFCGSFLFQLSVKKADKKCQKIELQFELQVFPMDIFIGMKTLPRVFFVGLEEFVELAKQLAGTKLASRE